MASQEGLGAGSDAHSETSIRTHAIRNKLNRIAIQTELAKMLVEKSSSKDEIIATLDKVLESCADCSQILAETT